MKFLKKYFCRYMSRHTCVDIESLIELLFLNVHQIKMIQVGANDGVLCDPLYKYVVNQKLTGIMLEPQKEVFGRLLENHNRSRGVFFENVALGNQDGSAFIYRVDPALIERYKDLGGVASFDKGHVKKEISASKKRLQLDIKEIDTYIISELVDVVTYK